jgi:hypothetical protein
MELYFSTKCYECNVAIEPGTDKYCADCYKVEQTLLELEGRLTPRDKQCVTCGDTISDIRLAALDTNICIKCSKVPKVFGLMDYSHKTAGAIVIVDGGDRESIRRMKNVYTRKR